MQTSAVTDTILSRTNLVSKLAEIKNSYKFMHFTTNFFIANLLKHLMSCQFTG